MTTEAASEAPAIETAGTPQAKTAIFARLNKVLAEVGRVAKNGHNDFHNYDYVKEDDLTTLLRPLLAKHGLAIVFGQGELRELPNNVLAVECIITLGDGEGNEVITKMWGTGSDKGDKALYKATTGAMKYWLYKTFLVSTGDDPENEDGAQGARAAAPKAAVPKTNGHAPAAAPKTAQPKAAAPAENAVPKTMNGGVLFVDLKMGDLPGGAKFYRARDYNNTFYDTASEAMARTVKAWIKDQRYAQASWQDQPGKKEKNLLWIQDYTPKTAPAAGAAQ